VAQGGAIGSVKAPGFCAGSGASLVKFPTALAGADNPAPLLLTEEKWRFLRSNSFLLVSQRDSWSCSDSLQRRKSVQSTGNVLGVREACCVVHCLSEG